LWDLIAQAEQEANGDIELLRKKLKELEDKLSVYTGTPNNE
jgi:hypothetical protein